MHLGLDIDGTITAAPVFFARLAAAWQQAGRQVHVISSRSDTPEVRRESEKELATLGVAYDGLHLLPSIEASQAACPHDHLDWYSRFLWQKIAIAQRLEVSVFFDDDDKVLRLFHALAPQIRALTVASGLDCDDALATELARALDLLSTC